MLFHIPLNPNDEGCICLRRHTYTHKYTDTHSFSKSTSPHTPHISKRRTRRKKRKKERKKKKNQNLCGTRVSTRRPKLRAPSKFEDNCLSSSSAPPPPPIHLPPSTTTYVAFSLPTAYRPRMSTHSNSPLTSYSIGSPGSVAYIYLPKLESI